MPVGWKIQKIGDVCTLMTGGTPSRNKPEYFVNGQIKWLVSGDVHKKEIHDCEGRITEVGFNNSNTKYLPLNSVIIALNGQGKTRGTVALLRTKATCNQSLVSIYPKNDTELMRWPPKTGQ
jgi:type I restriction enzyme S subunit